MPEKLLSAKKCFKPHNSEVTREAVSHIPESQKSYWRHKCAACAWEAGFAQGKRQGLAQPESAMDSASLRRVKGALARVEHYDQTFS